MIHRLRRIKAPTLIVWGKQDRLVPLAHGEAYRDAIRGAELKVLDRCGHTPMIERPLEFNALLLDHLPVARIASQRAQASS